MLQVLGWIGLAALLLVSASIARRRAERREARQPPPGEWIEVQGRRHHLRRAGAGGPAIVFEAGGGCSSAMWWPFQDRLAELATVICHDRAGLGWSDPLPVSSSVSQRSEELLAVLRATGIPGPYVLVGLSYGGPVIRVFAARYPDLVAGLVFVDASHEAVFAAPGAQTYLKRSAGMLRFIGRLAAVGVPRLLRMRGPPQASAVLPFSETQRRVLASRFPTAHAFRVGADEFASMLSIADTMRGLDSPGSLGTRPICAVSHGKPFPGPFAVLEDNHLQGQQQLAALSTRGEVVVAEHSSHAIPLEEPELVLECIRRVWKAARDQHPQ
jgi:pimeloyl-ACP methyl ester carboxylesterase